MTVQITLPPPAPSRADRPTFPERADNWVTWQQDHLVPEINALAVEVNANTDIAKSGADAAAVAVATANFKGAWSSLTGPLATPACVYHSGAYWVLLSTLADVTSKVPGVASEWVEAKTTTSLPYFFASGTVAQGDPVSVNSDGTVSKPVAVPATIGTDTTLPLGSVYADLCVTSGGFVVAAYLNNSPGSVRCVAASVGAGGALTLGAEATISISLLSSSVYVTALADNKFLLHFKPNSRWYLAVGEVNPSTLAITLGAGIYAQSAGSSTGEAPLAVFDPESGKVIITGYSNETAPYNRMYVGTVSGTSLTLGAAVDLGSGLENPFPQYLGENKFMVFGSASGKHLYKLVTVSGTTASVGTAVNTGLGDYFTMATATADSDDLSFVLAAYENTTFNTKFVLVSVTNTTPTISQTHLTGSTQTMQWALYPGKGGAFDSKSGRFVFWLLDRTSYYGRCVEFHYDRTSIRFAAETVVVSSSSPYGGIVYAADADRLLVGAGVRTIRPFKGPYSTSRSYIGIAQDSADSGEALRVATGQYVDANQSALTPGQGYYLTDSGTLTQTYTGYFAGTSVGPTKLLVKG